MRSFLLRLLYITGFFRLWISLQPRSITFIMLHGVMDDQDENSQWHPFRSYISRNELETSLALLKRYYEFISIDQAMDLLDGKGTFKRQYCVMTFDDGLRNNLTHAMPILRRHHVPAVMYLVTDQIERQEPFWFDRLDYAIQNAAPSTESIHVFGKLIKIEHGGVKSFKRTFLNIRYFLYGAKSWVKPLPATPNQPILIEVI